jgi:hypothetical protein
MVWCGGYSREGGYIGIILLLSIMHELRLGLCNQFIYDE